MKFHEYVGVKRPRYTGDFGIEIETESLRSYDPPLMDHWTTHADGSLRHHGIEYVLVQPLNYDGVVLALEEFSTKTAKIKFMDTVYSSVHVHVNISTMEMIELANFVTLYMLFENVLNRYCGPDRDGNLFCLKTQCAETTVNVLVDMFKAMNTSKNEGLAHYSSLSENQLKYAALNLFTMRKFHSLEIRTHRGSTDSKEILRWIDIINAVKIASSRFSSPHQILMIAKQIGYEAFFNSVFNADLRSYLWTDYSLQDIDLNIWYVLLIAKSADWATWPCMKDSNKEFKLKYKTLERNISEVEEHQFVPIPEYPPRPMAPPPFQRRTTVTNTVGNIPEQHVDAVALQADIRRQYERMLRDVEYTLRPNTNVTARRTPQE